MNPIKPTTRTVPLAGLPSDCPVQQRDGTTEIEDISKICEACGECEVAAQFETSSSSSFLSSYQQHVQERARMAEGYGVAPKPLNALQVQQLLHELETADRETAGTLLQLLETRVPPGVDDAAAIKAQFLANVAAQKTASPALSREHAIRMLGTMQGGYNVAPLVDLLHNENKDIAALASEQLKRTLLIFDAFTQVEDLHKNGVAAATEVLVSWANAEWFLERPPVPEKMTVTVFRVPGEINTDDLSPAQDAWSRPDIPLHALSFFKHKRPGVEPLKDGFIGPLEQLESLKSKGFPVVLAGDVVGTGSSRKSAANSVLWHMGEDIPYVPNVRRGGVCLGGTIAPIFFNTMEDSGALPIVVDVSVLNMGDIIDIYPLKGVVRNHETDENIAEFKLQTDVLLDEVRAGGRIPLIIGRNLTQKARQTLGKETIVANIFRTPRLPEHMPTRGWTLAQKIVGKACGLRGVAPGQYCEPRISTVGSQDTTGPMTRDELLSLACVRFSADLVMQSFCHTAAYPKKVDIQIHKTLPDFFRSRGGVALKPGDGIIHSWLNRMALPDAVGTGADSHTRFPIGISFPAGSGLVAFAAATGTMPLDMPESVLVRFTGKMQPGITLRDLVQAIPFVAIQQGLVSAKKGGKANVFSGRIIEIEGLSHLECEQAFELTAATAERSAAACTVKLDQQSVIRYVKSNVTLLKWLISKGYGDADTLKKRITQMEEWLLDPVLLEADPHAEYAAVLDINMDEIKEPVLALPNDPDACAFLSQVAGTPVDEVFIGSCMCNIGQFRSVAEILGQTGKPVLTRLFLCPPTKMDKVRLREEGYYSTFCTAGGHTELPGCSLCMGNQLRVATGSTVVSTSTRNFPNRMGNDANVYLASAELAAITSILGRLPTVEEYMHYMEKIIKNETEIYQYLQFDQMQEFINNATESRKY